MNKLGTKLGAIAMSAVMALSFAPSAAITSLAAGDGLTDPTADSNQTVYVCYDANSGEHLWTTEKAEVDFLIANGWSEGNPVWKAPIVGEAVYRLYSPSTGEHHYTANKTEVAWLVKQGWTNEKTAFLTPDPEDDGATPILCYRNPSGGRGAHHYTISEDEAAILELAGWDEEDPRFYGYELNYKPVVEELTVSINNTTPKVGDTLIATVEPADATVVYQWYADGEAIEGATEDELLVTSDLLGALISVEVTDAAGNSAIAVCDDEVEAPDNEIEITSADATAANTILITFAEAVPFDTEITVQKSTLTTTTTGTVTFDEDYKSATFVASANFTTGTYVVTAESDDSSDTAEVEITTQRVDDIVITSTTALTSAPETAGVNAGKILDAYVYYKVFDQYDQDITENTSVEVNGSYDIAKVDRNTGCITIRNAQGFRYNDLITVSIVHAQSGTVATKSLNVGLQQYVDSISVEGFLSLSEPTKLQSTIPAGFNKNEWLVLFKGYDQDGNEMDVDNYDFTTDVTVTTTATLLIGTDSFKTGSTLAAQGGADTYTIDGKDYSAFTIQPGMYVDKGGEATLNIISNKTGTQSYETIEIGAQDVLQALVLNDPGTVTDGDTVTIPYTATTTTGNSTTDFETIVRSTNALTLTASVGTLLVKEDNNGKAVIQWADDITKVSNYLDNVDRPVTFTTVVVGGNANTSTIYVSDYAYPVTITSTKLPEYMVQGSASTATITLGKKGDAVYVDQYGRTLTAPDAAARLVDIATDGNTNMDFAVKVDKTAGSTIEAHLTKATPTITVSGTEEELFNAAGLVDANGDPDLGDLTVTTFNAATGVAVTDPLTGTTTTIIPANSYNWAPASNTLKLSIETKKTTETPDHYAAAGKKLTETVTTIGLDKLSNFAIKPISGLTQLTTAASAYGNLQEYIDGTTGDTVTPIGVTGIKNKSVTVTGQYNGNTITVPAEFCAGFNDADTVVTVAAGKLAIGTKTTLAPSDLYSTTSFERKTCSLPVAVEVATIATSGAISATTNKISTTIEVQDGQSKATTIKFYNSSAEEITTGTFNADELKYVIDGSTWNLLRITGASAGDFIQANPWRNVYYAVYDQYGERIDGAGETFKIANIVESAGPLTHVTLNGFAVTANQSAAVSVDYAELGDTFDLTVSFDGASATIAITQGADNETVIANDYDLDKPFRKTFLGYDR